MLKRILFVDDEPQILDGFRRMLRGQRRTWDMYFVESVAAALAETARFAFDTIITDINMPIRDGFEFLQVLQDTGKSKDIPVIVLTGQGEDNTKRRALDLGATDLLDKPVHPADLVARIQNVLRLKSYRDELKAHNDCSGPLELDTW